MKYELRFKINRFDFEILGVYENPALAYGMKKKLAQENPSIYPKQKLYVKIFN